MTDRAEIGPCPFCAVSDADVFCHDPEEALDWPWYVFCRCCFCHGPGGESEADAIKLWNERRQQQRTT